MTREQFIAHFVCNFLAASAARREDMGRVWVPRGEDWESHNRFPWEDAEYLAIRAWNELVRNGKARETDTDLGQNQTQFDTKV